MTCHKMLLVVKSYMIFVSYSLIVKTKTNADINISKEMLIV
jgi:hypothetical protein